MARKSRKPHNIKNKKQDDFRTYKTAVYIRLSVEDLRKKTSDSIGTQKAMLMEFMKTQPDLQIYDVYEDVNYTGTNFDRPAFARMIEDIKAGLADCVLVKDLSRFGRNFLETGRYLEITFPSIQIRFISVNDNYDSLTSSLDEIGLMIPLKNLMNQHYARDISRKVQSSFRVKQKRGEFCGSFAPYGYVKVGSSFIVDEKTAPVVRQIFQWILAGNSDYAIVMKLNEFKILPPNRYRFEQGIVKSKKYEKAGLWHTSAVKRISENPIYTGNMVSGKYKSDFLRGGGTIVADSDDWIITPDSHPAIINNDTFESVNEIRKTRKQK